MESGAECVTAAWQNILHVESSQNTMNKRKHTRTHPYAVIQTRLTCGRLSPVLSKSPVILLHGLDLGVLVRVFFLFHCRARAHDYFPNC